MNTKFDPYESSYIKRDDTDAAKLSVEQAQSLGRWCDMQTCSLTYPPATLQHALDLYHASIAYDLFESWIQEEPEMAALAYNAVMPAELHLDLDGIEDRDLHRALDRLEKTPTEPGSPKDKARGAMIRVAREECERRAKDNFLADCGAFRTSIDHSHRGEGENDIG